MKCLSLQPVCWGRTVTCFCIVLVFNTLVNIFNRVIIEYWLGGDVSKRPVNCATLLFLALYYLVTRQPSCYFNFTVGLIQAELFLQCFSFVWTTQLMSVRVDHLLPFMCDTFLGSMSVFKLLLLLCILGALIYIMYCHKDDDIDGFMHGGGGAGDAEYNDDDMCEHDYHYEDMCNDYNRSFKPRSCQTFPSNRTPNPIISQPPQPPPPPNWNHGPSRPSPYAAGSWGCGGK